MIRVLFFLMLITIVFLVGLIIGIERESADQKLITEQETFAEQFVVDDEVSEQLWEENVDEQSLLLSENERLLHRFAHVSETIVHKFYQMIVLLLYNFSKIFI